jgi:hypothetical protein
LALEEAMMEGQLLLQIQAVLAGAFFGTYPYFLNQSGMSGSMAAFAYCAIASIGLLPLALYNNGFSIPTANWTMLLAAGFLGTIGVLLLNEMLAHAPSQDIGTLLVLMTVSQITAVALCKIISGGGLSLDKIGGFIAAAVSAYLLLR